MIRLIWTLHLIHGSLDPREAALKWYLYCIWVVMHDGMQYDPIQGQGQGHEPLKVGNSSVSKAVSSAIYNGSWQLTTDS